MGIKYSKHSDNLNLKLIYPKYKFLKFYNLWYHYIKDIHKIEKIVDKNSKDSISIDGSLFIHQDNMPMGIVDLIDNRTRAIGVEIAKNRTTENIKKTNINFDTIVILL